MNKKINVLIADDHAVVREGMRYILSKTQNIVLVGEAGNGNEVLDLIRSIDSLDVLLLDLDMPEKDGLDVLLEVKIEYPELPVIVMSVYSEEHYGLRLIKAGASGFLAKDSAPDQLVEAIKKVSAGGKFISSNLAEKIVQHWERDLEIPLHQNLSNREFQIFCMIASGESPKNISEKLSISMATVSTHRNHILKKLDLKNNAELTLYASKEGLISKSINPSH